MHNFVVLSTTYWKVTQGKIKLHLDTEADKNKRKHTHTHTRTHTHARARSLMRMYTHTHNLRGWYKITQSECRMKQYVVPLQWNPQSFIRLLNSKEDQLMTWVFNCQVHRICLLQVQLPSSSSHLSCNTPLVILVSVILCCYVVTAKTYSH